MGACPSKRDKKVDNNGNQANSCSGNDSWMFSLEELAAASNNFSDACLLGRGRFGSVFIGRLQRTGQIVAIKKLHNADGHQGFDAFLNEAVILIEFHHPNLVSMIGFCVDGAERLLVLEYMARGSLDDHLFSRNPKMVPLDWNTRMKIALSVARGLAYLHLNQDPPIIHRNLKCSKILLGVGYQAKLSGFGLAKEGPAGDQTHVTTSVVGTSGYIAPEYARTRRLTVKSDIYGFGAVLFEIITGRRFDEFNNAEAEDLAAWAPPYVDPENFLARIADPSLQGKYPRHEFAKVAGLAKRCVQEDPNRRPPIDEVVYLLTNLSDFIILHH